MTASDGPDPANGAEPPRNGDSSELAAPRGDSSELAASRGDSSERAPPRNGDSSELAASGGDAPSLVKLLQGYIWHPLDLEIDLGDWLPATIDPGVHLLWDPLERAPFTFFDDGTLAETQQLYQFTVVQVDPGPEPERLVPWLAERIQEKLEQTPAGVGWQVMEDLREIE